MMATAQVSSVTCHLCGVSRDGVKVFEHRFGFIIDIPLGWTSTVSHHHEDVGLFIEYMCQDCNVLLRGKDYDDPMTTALLLERLEQLQSSIALRGLTTLRMLLQKFSKLR